MIAILPVSVLRRGHDNRWSIAEVDGRAEHEFEPDDGDDVNDDNACTRTRAMYTCIVVCRTQTNGYKTTVGKMILYTASAAADDDNETTAVLVTLVC